jgi:crotonobetainyl-CoA:carnitine CoA-transferase CaiB-like acyl-CoA transferase
VRPLADVRVLDLTQVLAGPFCTLLLADMGAEVIKIERPGTGELARQLGPFVEGRGGQRGGGYWWRLARNKRGLALDLGQDEGRALFKRLVAVADVVVENFRPGVMERWGLGYDTLRELNPGIVYATISGFGHPSVAASPYWQHPAYDITVQALGGVAEITGQPDGPPTLVGARIGDLFPAVLTAYGIVVALHERQRTGRGRHVDVAMYDAMVALMEREIANYALTGEIARRGQDLVLSPAGVYRAADGYFAVAAVSQEQWERCARAIGRADLLDDPRLATGVLRAQHDAIVRAALEAWAADKTKHEATRILLAHDVPASPVQNVAEVVADPHVAARRMLLTIDDPIIGERFVAGAPIKLRDLADEKPTPPPQIGQHTDELLTTLLGLSAAEIAALRERGVV